MADDPAEELYLKAGKVLFHGTLAEKFTHEYLESAGPSPVHYIHPPTPDGPAWFANSEKFALHAAIRFTNPGKPAEIQLHLYEVKYPIRTMSLSDMANFRVFLKEQFQIQASYNGIMEGVALAKNSIESWLEGYALLKDTVRGEPEYVLFASGMKKLQFLRKRTVNVVPIDQTHSNLVDVSSGNMVAYYTCGAGPGVLV